VSLCTRVCLYTERADGRTGVEITSRILAQKSLYHFTLNFGLIAEAANLFSDLRTIANDWAFQCEKINLVNERLPFAGYILH
jgi:hypothetical protein